MNKVILIGRLTKDPEIRATQSGKKVASFSIAVDDGKDSSGQKLTQYFNCSAWEVLAERLEQFVKKGHRVAITGKLQNRSWDKPDGTKAYATDVLVRELEMLTSKMEAETINHQEGSNNSMASSPSPQSQSKPNQNPPKEDEGELPEIDVDSINVQMPF